jgi:hypothetical protein
MKPRAIEINDSDRHRFRIYELRRGTPYRIAEADDTCGVGQAIVTIGRFRREAGLPPRPFGVIEEGVGWLADLWGPKEDRDERA